VRSIAIKMLTGDRAKYFGLIFSITFSTFLMSQQVSIFISLLGRTAAQIRDVPQADIWVMDPQVEYVDVVKPLRDTELSRVRSVSGVEWALPLYKGLSVIRARDGKMQQALVLGVDDATLTGGPPKMVLGEWASLASADAMIMDKSGYKFIWPGEPLSLGRVIEINDHRFVIKGICETSAPFLTFPIVYTKFSDGAQLHPGERNQMTFIIVKAASGISPEKLAQKIHKETQLQALTSRGFQWRSIRYYLERTGIPINFGITVLLGFLVGAAIAAQTFYIFVLENISQYGALKAIGVSNRQMLMMVLVQALLVAFIGYGIGIGLAALFFEVFSKTEALRGFMLHWEVVVGSAFVVSLIAILSSAASIRKVFVLDPAVAFRA